MRLTTCPTATIGAPVALVWRLLTDPAAIGRWSGAALVAASPPGPAAAGQRIEFAAPAGPARAPVIFHVREVDDAAHRMRVDVYLPLGIVNHETITCASVSPAETFVSFG